MKNPFSSLFDSNDKQIKKIRPIIDQINSFESVMQSLSDEELAEQTVKFRERLNVDLEKARTEYFDAEYQKDQLMALLPEAFAVVREAADRVAQHRHFEVQLMAGYFLADNKVTELFTGEGKTNAATLAMYLYGLTGRGAHLVTVNDYLARRDGEWNGHLLSALGMSVGIINSGTQYKFVSDDEAIALKGSEAEELIKERKKQHEASGRLKLDLMTGVNLVECTKHEAYACDLVYGTNNEFGFDYLRDNMAQRLEDLVQTRLHYAIVDEADSILIDEARTPLIISQSAEASNEMYRQFASLAAQLEKDSDYTVDEKANSVAMSDQGVDKVEKILGVDNVYEDAKSAYHLENALKAKELYKNDDEYLVRDGEVLIVDQFTGRVLPGRRYSEGLHQAIEAKEGVEVKRESKTLATITLQNYFRLYDYLAGMTGTALTEAEEFAKVYKLDVIVVPTNKPVVRIDENDEVYRTVEAKFNAVRDDIISAHELGQPVLVGTTSVEKSEYLSNLLAREGVPHEVLNAKYHEKEAKIVQKAGQKGQVTIATNMAGRGTDIGLGEGVKELGGLYVIGTERHESRRIDNQLRGRSGRQGDPGRSKFFVSFEDELMRLFGGDRMKAIMGRTGLDENIPISIGLVGKTIENAQKKVESHNFDIRKNLVQYDDVMNQQRDIIYGLRKRILQVLDEIEYKEEEGSLSEKELKEKLSSLDLNALLEDLDGFSMGNKDSWDLSEFDKFPQFSHPMIYWVMKRYVERVRFIISAQLSDDMKIDAIEERKSVLQLKSMMGEELASKAIELLGYAKDEDYYRHLLTIKTNDKILDEYMRWILYGYIYRMNQVGGRVSIEMARALVLQTIDYYWMEHLDGMADLREGIGMQSIAQRDPLVAYKNEGFGLFEKMLADVDEAVATRFLKVQVVQQGSSPAEQGEAQHQEAQRLVGGATTPERITGTSGLVASNPMRDMRAGDMSKQTTRINNKEKIGRNDPCPCGSGKKYKKCHINKEPKSVEEKAAFKLYFESRKEWESKYL